jgi:hypothetical protein
MAMRDQKLIVPQERVLPEDQRKKYEARALPELREDVYKFARRLEIVEKEKDRQDKAQRDQGRKVTRYAIYICVWMLLVGLGLLAIWIRIK